MKPWPPPTTLLVCSQLMKPKSLSWTYKGFTIDNQHPSNSTLSCFWSPRGPCLECFFIHLKPFQNPIHSLKPATSPPWLPWSVLAGEPCPLLSFPDILLVWGQELFWFGMIYGGCLCVSGPWDWPLRMRPWRSFQFVSADSLSSTSAYQELSWWPRRFAGRPVHLDCEPNLSLWSYLHDSLSKREFHSRAGPEQWRSLLRNTEPSIIGAGMEDGVFKIWGI